MWNYAAVFRTRSRTSRGTASRPFPASRPVARPPGERIGPEPLVTGFDTHWLCQRVAAQEKPWTWHLLNWRIAIKEFAISGAEHNQRIRDMQFPLFLKETCWATTAWCARWPPRAATSWWTTPSLVWPPR